uniref:Transmembrane protein 160 n=1 Tax=Salarias fasciatus TaxID=181472 RepID=A0A672HU71_SALFA
MTLQHGQCLNAVFIFFRNILLTCSDIQFCNIEPVTILFLSPCTDFSSGCVRLLSLFLTATVCVAGFLSWFRNGLLATGIGVIAFVQSEVGREAGYAFFLLGGVCVSFGGASYIGSLLALRRMMMLSVPALLLQGAAVGSVALFWLCAVSLYIGRLEVEIIHEDEEGAGEDEDECRECRERREHRGYRAGPDGEDSDSGGQNK